MSSSWKDIAAFVDATEPGQKVGRHAAHLAKRQNAHLVGIYSVQKLPILPDATYARGAGISRTLESHRHANESLALAAGRAFGDLSARLGVSSEFRVVWRDAADEDATLRALHCDLIVAGHPRPPDQPERWTAERLLLASGAPVLMVPETWQDEPIGKTVVIAWNASRAARRAVNDALPFLTSATRVVVMIIDGERIPDQGAEGPAPEILRHLARHDVRADLVELVSQGSSVSDILLHQAAALNADLLIIGAYSRPRTSELLFGGVTRSLLGEAKIPVFLSR